MLKSQTDAVIVMDVKQAVDAAKSYLQDVFGAEVTTAPRLEEVWFDDDDRSWCVTLGFFRKPDDLSKNLGIFSTYAYKVVRIDNSSERPNSIMDRERVAA